VLDKNLVNDISVQVRSGGILAIVGASGAGGRAFHGAYEAILAERPEVAYVIKKVRDRHCL